MANQGQFSTCKLPQRLLHKVDHLFLDILYSRSLVYNTCRDDPTVDRRALALQPIDPYIPVPAFTSAMFPHEPPALGCPHDAPHLMLLQDTHILLHLLLRRTEPVHSTERLAPAPYLPGLRAPCYLNVGRKRQR